MASNIAIVNKANDQYVERAHASMHKHLVDDDLKKQRRDKREYLEEERSDQYLAEKITVLMNGA